MEAVMPELVANVNIISWLLASSWPAILLQSVMTSIAGSLNANI